MDNEKIKPLHLRLNKRPTRWLIELPPGEYTIKELKKITDRGKSTIKQRLDFLEIPRRYEHAESGHNFAVYIWGGIDEYDKQTKKK